MFGIFGCQGAGKTSLATAFLRTDYKYHRKWRTSQGKDLARRYYEANGIKLDVSDRLYFSNCKILLDKRRGLYTHEIELQRLALPNDDFEVQYLPRGSVVFIMEADVLAFCRDWESLNNYLIDLLKYARHNLLTIIFDGQIGGALDKALRQLIVEIYYVVSSGIKRYWLFWKQQVWKYLLIRNQLNAVAKELASVGVDIKIPVVEWCKFSVRGNVFDCYNSFSGEAYFLKGIEKVGYVYSEHTEGDITVKGIERFWNAHPLARPEEMMKQKAAAKRSGGGKTKEEKVIETVKPVENGYNPFPK